ncbi:hypothetical protein [Methanoregula sp.]|uniref:hypothetical protein n=1 Tax=Methanoregula sp. TaxID=2052170 RepID=UPI0035643592
MDEASAFMIIGLIASIASLVLAIIAIWLSIVFFRMSSEFSTNATEASKDIGSSVERLEKLFDKLYSDTFSMMRETVTDMRKHMWPDENSRDTDLTVEIDKKADEKVSKFKEEIDRELRRLLEKQSVTEANVGSLRDEMGDLINRAISVSRNAHVEAREETIRGHILRILSEKKETTAADLVDTIQSSAGRTVQELQRMKEDNLIYFEDKRIGPNSRIRIR